MNIFDFYTNPTKRQQLLTLLKACSQNHPQHLAPNFLEKDIWVTEILRLLYNENLIGDYSIAFKGGTALSKCWQAIARFSEDIDLSIHWADLAQTSDEVALWEKSTKNNSQRSKFRKDQTNRLTLWTEKLTGQLNHRLAQYGIEGLYAELEANSNGEKIDIHFPAVTTNTNEYQLDYVLLEFGGRNRGLPTVAHEVGCYLTTIPGVSSTTFPTAFVQAYRPDYILWEKLSALHQFSTQDKEPTATRLARHWYDVDCLLQNNFADPFNSEQAKQDVVEMKAKRWPEKGVDFTEILEGRLRLIPDDKRLSSISDDHQNSINGGMFFGMPDNFNNIVTRLIKLEYEINENT